MAHVIRLFQVIKHLVKLFLSSIIDSIVSKIPWIILLWLKQDANNIKDTLKITTGFSIFKVW